MMSSIESTSTFHSRLSAYKATVLARLRDLAPYAVIELVLPGGSLLALLLWFYRRYKKGTRSSHITGICIVAPIRFGVGRRQAEARRRLALTWRLVAMVTEVE